MKFYRVLALISVFLCVNCDESFTRNLTAILNPGCPPDNLNLCEHVTFVHIMAESNEDTLHYLWDFSGVPSIMLALTPKNTTLNIDWYSYLNNQPGSLNFSQKPMYEFATILNKIYAFYDPDDNANLDPKYYKNITTYLTHKLTWNRVNFTSNSEFVSVEVKTKLNNGTIGMKLTSFAKPNHGEELPHLLHSSNATQIDIVIDNVTTGFWNSRFAIQLLLASSDRKIQNTYVVTKRRNLDDEFTPGIFDIIDVEHKNLTKSGYLQYRPVCYLEKERDVSSSTETKYTKIRFITDVTEYSDSMVPIYFSDQFYSILHEGFNISFGIAGDGYYDKNKYTSFSLLMGIGEPMKERLSTFVIATALVGLGIPLVVLVCGGIFLGIKRLRNR